MKKIINFFLNKLISPILRYKGSINVGQNSIFLNNFSIINSKLNQVAIGEDSIVGATIVFEHKEGVVSIGDRVYIGDSKIICKNSITFEDDVLVAWGVTFYDHNSHSLNYKNRQKDISQVLFDHKNHRGNYLTNKNWSDVESRPILIKKNAWIGMDSLILKGVTIGEGAIVGACSVVTKDVMPYTIVGGNPAKIIKYITPDER